MVFAYCSERKKKMLNKLKKILYALPFGLKAADEMITTSNTDAEEGSAIHKQVENKSVFQDLVNGELTQQVEELRYETFKAEEMSNEYKYIGNGNAVKKKGSENDVKEKRKKFVQYNSHQEYGFLESMKMLENENNALKDDWKERKIFKATYKNPCVRFRLENYAYKVRVDLTDNSYRTYIYFIDDNLDRKTRPLVNFIKKTKSEIDKIEESGDDKKLIAYKERNELCSEIESFSFTTINATNDVPNGIDYNFREACFEGIEEEDGYVIIVYKWRKFDGNILLSERFKSKTAEEKFNNKEKREGYKPVVDLSAKKEELVIRDRDEDNLREWLDD